MHTKSPNESLSLKIENDGGSLYYSLFKNGIEIIERSKLGIVTNIYEFSDGITITKKKERRKHHTWDQVWGEQKTLIDHHNELELFTRTEKNQLSAVLRFRLFDDGLGFRYEIPSQMNNEEYRILNELTEFNMAEDSPSWWIPAYAYRRYEFLYANSLISEISRDTYSKLVENLNPPRLGPEAVQTPFTMQRSDGIAISIHEANLTNYSSMTLKASGTKNLECDLVPWSDGTKVYVKGDLTTPWRTIIVGNNAAELAESTLTLNLNEPNAISNTDWIKPGKYIGLWWEMIGTNESTWGSGPHHGAKTERVLNYIDFGSKYGFDGVLFT